ADLREPPARLCALLHAQPAAQPLLPPMPAGHGPRCLERRSVFRRAAAPPSGTRGGAADRRAVGGKIDRPLAQLRRGADALAAAFLGGRRRPHPSPDRRQGFEPGVLRCRVPLARADRILSAALDRGPRWLFGDRARARVEGGALLVVDDDADAPLSRRGFDG